jgi:hypothetical protein
MKTFFIATLCLTVAAPAAAECIRTPAGRTVCRNAAGEIVAEPPATAVPVAPVGAAPGAVVVAPGAAVAPHAVYGAPAYTGGVSTVHGEAGGAAYNPRTGNAAVSHTNPNGVTTTQTSRGGEAKTKNGMGVAHGAGGTTCVKGKGQGKCN